MRKKKIHPLSQKIDYEQIYRTNIAGWDDLSDDDKELCRKVNRYRVEALHLPPIIHPEVVHRNLFL